MIIEGCCFFCIYMVKALPILRHVYLANIVDVSLCCSLSHHDSYVLPNKSILSLSWAYLPLLNTSLRRVLTLNFDFLHKSKLIYIFIS